jgi:hypothetical protein
VDRAGGVHLTNANAECQAISPKNFLSSFRDDSFGELNSSSFRRLSNQPEEKDMHSHHFKASGFPQL